MHAVLQRTQFNTLNLLYNAVGYYKENNATAQLVTVIVRKQPQCISDEGPRKIQDYFIIRLEKMKAEARFCGSNPNTVLLHVVIITMTV